MASICFCNSGVTQGAGAYAPMPPVFKPSSLSKALLWSCAAGINTAVLPSHKAKQDASGPVKKDSMTHVSPAAPKALSDIISLTAEIVSALLVGIKTPFPAASPEALTTCRSDSSKDSTYAIASAASVKFLYLAVGIPCSCKKSFVKAFQREGLVSVCAKNFP